MLGVERAEMGMEKKATGLHLSWKLLGSSTSMTPLNFLKGIVTDIDGVWFHGEKLQDGAFKLLDAAQRRRLKMTFASNGAGSRSDVVKKFGREGIQIAEADVMTAGYAVAKYLCKEQLQSRGEFLALFLGPDELRMQCHALGIEAFLYQNDVWDPKKKNWIAERTPTHIVTARHDYNINTIEAAVAALVRGAQWVASGMDHAVTTENGDLRAGTGTLVAAIQRLLATTDSLSNAVPNVMGKPHPRIVQACLDRMKIPQEQVAMLGDSLETDMPVARQLKMTRLLVLSGVTSADLARQNLTMFDHIFSDIGSFADVINS